MYGYVGKILRIDLSTSRISTLDTKDYEQWGGGHGIGSAIFWDLCKNKAISGFDPRNVVTIMTSPLSGTLTPSASGRTEVTGIGVQSWPVEWYTRSNFGGRFSAQLKYAGWDGIVIEGKADKPVWIDIRNGDVAIRDAKGVWGMDTWSAQEVIWDEVMSGQDNAEWMQLGTSRDSGRTTQKPAVLAIGQAGENLSRIACLVHDAGNAAGQGGFGGVWGSKNLKAVSVIGTGSVEIADPKALMDARLWMVREHTYNPDDPLRPSPIDNFPQWGTFTRMPGFGPLYLPTTEPSRPQGCTGCYYSCRRRTKSGYSNESQCVESLFNMCKDPHETYKSTDLLQKYGINVYGIFQHGYLRELYKMGIMGKGKKIEADLPFEKYGTYEWADALLSAIAYRKGIGDDLAEGLARFAEKHGRLEDLSNGLLNLPNWGYNEHYDPRLEIEWSYGSILGDRDINEHGINFFAHWMPTVTKMAGVDPILPADVVAEKMGKRLSPYNDPDMLDYSEEGIYSEGKVKMIAWHRHYTRFWKQSLSYCDWAWPVLIDPNHPDWEGASPEAEPKFYNAVTGKNITFEEGMEIGRKIWNLDRAIWILQGRHRDLEKFAGYVYDVPTKAPYWLPVKENGEWKFSDCLNRTLDREKFEDWKTRFYEFEGWDSATGWPKRQTLESLGLKNVADELDKNGKLG